MRSYSSDRRVSGLHTQCHGIESLKAHFLKLTLFLLLFIIIHPFALSRPNPTRIHCGSAFVLVRPLSFLLPKEENVAAALQPLHGLSPPGVVHRPAAFRP